MQQYTSLASWITSVTLALEGYGCDAETVFKEAGFNTSEYPDGRIPVEMIGRVWDTSARLTRDPAIGIKAAPHFKPSTWHALGLAMICSNSLRDALRRLSRFYEIITNVINIRCYEEGDSLCIEMATKIDVADIGITVVDYGFASILTMCRSVYPKALIPNSVALERPTPSDTTAFEAFYQCPIQFGAERHIIKLPLEAVDLPLVSADPVLADYQDKLSADYLARYGNGSLALRVQDEVMRLLPGGEPSQQAVAESLHMSVRNLQRKLNTEDTSFNEVLTDVRMTLAREYLTQNYRSFTEISYLLGFSDHSNFTRAFKRWFSQTPTAYRQALEASS